MNVNLIILMMNFIMSRWRKSMVMTSDDINDESIDGACDCNNYVSDHYGGRTSVVMTCERLCS